MDDTIFARRYFGYCLACTFCGDACCQYGVDVTFAERDRILAHADVIEGETGITRDRWFTGEVVIDPDYAGGGATRTRVEHGGCVFLQREARGCALHAIALRRGWDYHTVKPIVSTLFPVTFGDGVLCSSEELIDGSLVCAGDGPSAYGMARGELEWYFGAEFVTELDGLEALVASA